MHLCTTCTLAFRMELADVAGIIPDNHGKGTLPSLPEELDTSLTRQDQLIDPRDPGGGTEIPLIFKVHVGEATWVLHSTLRAWVGDFGGDTALSPRALAGWFLEHLDMVRKSIDAGTMVDEITEAVHQARRAIDRPNDDRLYLGPCGSTSTSHYPGSPSMTNPCDEELYGQPWLDRAVCERCGTDYRITERQDWLRDRANKHPGTSVEVAGFLRLTGVACTPAQIRGYTRRKRLEPAGINDSGHPLYLISDVLATIKDRYARRTGGLVSPLPEGGS